MLSGFSKTLLASCVVITGLYVSPLVSPAGANQVQLHELLFNRKKREEFKRKRQKRSGTVQRTRPQQVKRKTAPKRKKKAVQIAKITGPQYFTYKPENVVTVALASFLPDLDETGSIALAAAQSSPVTLPPMTMLEPVAPPMPGAASVKTNSSKNLPEMVLLDPVAPPIDGIVGDAEPKLILPELVLMEPAAPRLASTDYFAIASSTPPENTVRVLRSTADAVRLIYAEKRDFLWSDGVEITDRAKTLSETLASADAHGLVVAHYAVPVPDLSDDQSERLRQLIAFDVELTARATRFALDLKDGAISPNKLSGYHDFSLPQMTADEAAKTLATADDPALWLATLGPQQREYAALQKELADLRDAKDDTIVFPEKVFMKPGAMSEVLPLVMKAIDRKLRDETRAAHSDALAAYEDRLSYTSELVELVRDVQRDLGLAPDGIVGPMTIARLAGETVASRIEKVELAMERLRWHPEQYADRHVVINAPEYRVRYLENGETALAMNVVVGKRQNQTYFFHDEIDHVVFNPYWGVPQSIIVNSYLPKLRRDSSYLDRNGFVVTTYGGKRISSTAINWHKFGSSVPYNIRQKPGPRNALGELKIMFPNEHAIYMHDTPAKELFGRDARAYSHGCVRLEDPRAMAAAVLGKNRSYVSAQIGGYEQAEKLTEKVPVYVGYFTAWLNDDGEIDYHPDVYQRDDYLKKAIEALGKMRGA